jgi:hypothetical protein
LGLWANLWFEDYLIWGDHASLKAYLNQPSQREGLPQWIYQDAAVANGIDQDPEFIKLADMDGYVMTIILTVTSSIYHED